MKTFRIEVMESERGWGQRYEYWDYETLDQAASVFTELNLENTANTAPNWYMQANTIEEFRNGSWVEFTSEALSRWAKK